VRKRIRGRVILLAIATLITGYYIVPSVAPVGGLPSLLPGILPRAERVNLGLDLQGGMHLVLEVQGDKAVESSTDRLLEEARRLLDKEKIGVARLVREGPSTVVLKVAKVEERDKAQRVLGELVTLDKLPGATPDELRLTLQSREVKRIEELAVRQSLETIRNRVDQFGVTEPHIVPEGDRRIVVQLPGIRDPQRAINIIGKTALLELKAVDPTLNPVEVEQGRVSLPPDLQLLYLREVDEEKRQVVGKRPIIVQRRPIVTGASLTDARVQPDDQGGWAVGFTLDREGARAFGEFTGANVGRLLAIVLDDVVYSAPVIRSRIEDRGQIEGSFTADSARDLAIVLRAGALPAPVKIIANLTV